MAYDACMQPLSFSPQPPAPLAERMRPTSLDHVIGQENLVGSSGPLRSLIERDAYRALLFWGPPGTGKTTVGRIISSRAEAKFLQCSGALTGVKEIRIILQDSQAKYRSEGKRDLLFLDEIHRFSKSQQDVLLSFLEEGSIIFIGATTENPSFVLNAALLSRCQVFCFSPLEESSMRALIRSAFAHPNGLGETWKLETSAEDLLVALSDGDGRRALSTLEMAASLSDGSVIDVGLVERAVQRKGLRYDRAGDEHYYIISALHKSVRNSDPDAALYWLARMIEGGEDPRFIARRLIRIASEDVGLADPWAILQATAAWDAAEKVGLPECDLALAQATVYLACAEKSNALYTGMESARRDVHEVPAAEVPMHLRNAPTHLMKSLGYGDSYQYAHDLDEGVADMDCLPDALAGRTYYQPKNRGFEKKLQEKLSNWRKLRRKASQGRQSGTQ